MSQLIKTNYPTSCFRLELLQQCNLLLAKRSIVRNHLLFTLLALMISPFCLSFVFFALTVHQVVKCQNASSNLTTVTSYASHNVSQNSTTNVTTTHQSTEYALFFFFGFPVPLLYLAIAAAVIVLLLLLAIGSCCICCFCCQREKAINDSSSQSLPESIKPARHKRAKKKKAKAHREKIKSVHSVHKSKCSTTKQTVKTAMTSTHRSMRLQAPETGAPGKRPSFQEWLKLREEINGKSSLNPSLSNLKAQSAK